MGLAEYRQRNREDAKRDEEMRRFWKLNKRLELIGSPWRVSQLGVVHDARKNSLLDDATRLVDDIECAHDMAGTWQGPAYSHPKSRKEG